MKLEDRLRSELGRSGGNTTVVTAPSIEELSAAADGRRLRNRVLCGCGALALVAAVILGVGLASDSSTSSVDVAASEDESEQVEDSATTEDAEEVAEPVDENVAAIAPEDSQLTEDSDLADVGRLLEADATPADIESRTSAVELAAGSGVLVVPTSDGSYGGLATRFGSDTTAIGIASQNGLDWVEIGLVGVPEGATASQLAEYEGAFVALFESFDSDVGERSVFVGTSDDLATWELSEPLSGEPFATGLAVGEAGVIVLGDDAAPDVWVGPLGGPYEQTARLAATSVTGVTTLGDEFLVAGRSADGATLFRSSNGVDWTGSALSSPAIPGTTEVVSVDDGAIVLSNADAEVSLISTDGGQTWSRVSADSQSISVNSETVGLFGFSNDDAVVAIANSESFSTAQIESDVADRISLIAAGDDEVILLQATEDGSVTWVIARR